MATKPSSLPRWAQTALGVDASNIATPTSGESDTGWTNGQTVISSSKMNWLFNLILKWFQYVKDGQFTADSGSAKPGVSGTGDTNQPGVSGSASGTAQPGVLGTNGGTNGDGVGGQGAGTGSGVVGTGGASGFGGNFSGNAGGVGGTALAGNTSGVVGNGHGSGPGVQGAGGPTGPGAAFTGGGTSGDGVTGTASAGNSRGGTFTGQGSGAGAQATGGTSGPGVQATAGGAGSPVTGALNLVPQTAPSAPVNGDLWATVTALFARIAGSTFTLAFLEAAQTFTGQITFTPSGAGSSGIIGNGNTTGAGVIGNSGSTTGAVGVSGVGTSGNAGAIGVNAQVLAASPSRGALHLSQQPAPTNPQPGDIWWDGTNFKGCKTAGVATTII